MCSATSGPRQAEEEELNKALTESKTQANTVRSDTSRLYLSVSVVLSFFGPLFAPFCTLLMPKLPFYHTLSSLFSYNNIDSV